MTISPIEAEASLAAIAATRRESVDRLRYRRAAPYVIGWGLVWAVGYAGSAMLPVVWASWLWIGLIVAMSALTVVMVRRRTGSTIGWLKIAAYTVLPTVGLIGLVNVIAAVFDIHSTVGVSALFCLLVAFAYAVSGLRYGARYMAMGIGLIALTAAGLLVLPPGLRMGVFFIDALVLISAGLWLRRA